MASDKTCTNCEVVQEVLRVEGFSSSWRRGERVTKDIVRQNGAVTFVFDIFPNGDGSEKNAEFVSITLSHSRRDTTVSVYVKATFILVNVNSQVVKSKKLERSLMENDALVIPQFVSRKEILDSPLNLLAQDSCVFKVDMRYILLPYPKIIAAPVVYDTITITHEWKVTCFNEFAWEVGQAMWSRPFPNLPGNTHDVKWQLRLFPRGEFEENVCYMSLFLFLVEHYSGKLPIKADVTASLMEPDNPIPLYTRTSSSTWVYSENTGYGWSKFLEFDRALSMTHDGCLTIKFEAKYMPSKRCTLL